MLESVKQLITLLLPKFVNIVNPTIEFLVVISVIFLISHCNLESLLKVTNVNLNV